MASGSFCFARQLDLRKSAPRFLLASLQAGAPVSCVAPQCSKANPLAGGRKCFEFGESGFKQRLHPCEVPAMAVMKCRRELNEPLKECFFRFSGDQPDFLPGFVRLEKFAGIEQGNSSLELFEFDCA